MVLEYLQSLLDVCARVVVEASDCGVFKFGPDVLNLVTEGNAGRSGFDEMGTLV